MKNLTQEEARRLKKKFNGELAYSLSHRTREGSWKDTGCGLMPLKAARNVKRSWVNGPLSYDPKDVKIVPNLVLPIRSGDKKRG